jgi:hypothetical protein
LRIGADNNDMRSSHLSRAVSWLLWMVLGLDLVYASSWVLVYRRVWMVHFCLAALAGSVLVVRSHRHWGAAGAGSVLIISLLTIVEFLFGINLPIDRLYPDPDSLRVADWIWPPGRMSAASALLLPWIALAVLQWHTRWRRAWWAYPAVAAVFLYAALLTHLYQFVGHVPVYVAYVNMGRGTAVLFVLLLAGLVLQRMNRPQRPPKVWHRIFVDGRWWNYRISRTMMVFRPDGGQSFFVNNHEVSVSPDMIRKGHWQMANIPGEIAAYLHQLHSPEKG